MKGVKRLYINLDWQKMKEIYPSIDDEQISCMKSKWDPFRDWKQGFDSDCATHCSLSDSCSQAFYDETLEKKGHFKQIIIPTEEKLFWGDKQVEIKDAE